MDLDFDWAECDAKRVDKPEPMKRKVTIPERMKSNAGRKDTPEKMAKTCLKKPASSSQSGPPVKKHCLKKPAAKSSKTAPKSVEKAKKEPSAEAQKTLDSLINF